MYTADQVEAAYSAMMIDCILTEDDDPISEIRIYDENDHLDQAATETAQAEERARLAVGRSLLASARLVYSRAVMSGNPIPEIDSDGETIIASLGYTATTEFFRRVGLKHVDDLVSVLECANKFNVSQQAVSQALDAGRLHAFVQPGAGKRQRRRLVSLSEAALVFMP